MITQKLKKLSPGLRAKIVVHRRKYKPSRQSPISNYLVHTKRHCNGGRTVDAGLWLRDHCDKGGKIFLSMAGAGSSFEMGVSISEMIRAGKIAAISVTGANLEESLYRYLSNNDYVYIPYFEDLTRREEKEFDHAGFRRITTTFLPEDETVRKVLNVFMDLIREAERTGKPRLWHEYFFELFRRKLVKPDNKDNAKNCWLYQAWLHNIPIFVPGIEDSTMGNIFAYFSYKGDHRFLKKYAQKEPIAISAILHSFSYMHSLAEWYMDNAKGRGLAFLELGGGISADFPICVVPHLKKDFLDGLSIKMQEKLIRAWAGFIAKNPSLWAEDIGK
jgi:deoxyhypusine synthase